MTGRRGTSQRVRGKGSGRLALKQTGRLAPNENNLENATEVSPMPLVKRAKVDRKRLPVVYNSPAEVEKKYPYMKPYNRGEVKRMDQFNSGYGTSGDEGDEFDDDFKMEEEYDGEQEDEPMDEELIFSQNEPRESSSSKFLNHGDTGFGINSFLSKPRKEKTSIEKLKDAVNTGNIVQIGSSLRQGFSDKTLTEIQVEEYIKNAPTPAISLLQFHHQLEAATEADKNSIHMGQMFLTKLALSENKTINKLKASVSSLASSFAQQTKVALMVKRTLDTSHIISATEEFPRIDLVIMYNKLSLIGDSAFTQMTNFLIRIFKKALTPNYTIWYYTYRPKCVRMNDKHFVVFPEAIADSLIEFSYDAVGIYLPDNLLFGEIDMEDEFVQKLKLPDPAKEIKRRRKEREMVADTMKMSISQALNYLREYHYSAETGQLANCNARSSCTHHLMWRDLKLYREFRRKNSLDTEQFEIDDVIGFAVKDRVQDGYVF